MSKNSNILKKLSILLYFQGNYDFNVEDLKYMYNEKVSDSLFKLYMCMLIDDEKSFNEFNDSYIILSDDEKEYIKNKYIEIIKAQKSKVKEKKHE